MRARSIFALAVLAVYAPHAGARNVRIGIINDYGAGTFAGRETDELRWRHEAAEAVVKETQSWFDVLTEGHDDLPRFNLTLVDTITLREYAPWETVSLSEAQVLSRFSTWAPDALASRKAPDTLYVLFTTTNSFDMNGLTPYASFGSSTPFAVINAASDSFRVLAFRLARVLAISMGARSDLDEIDDTDGAELSCIGTTSLEKGIMHPDYAFTGSVISEPRIWAWSSCTAHWIGSWLAANPEGSSSGNEIPPPLCGNGIVDADEECDCVGNDASCDPCCDTSTCKLVSGAICSAFDTCCTDTCTFKPRGETCRRSSSYSSCDPAEVCSGASAHCPVDVQRDTGVSCADYYGRAGTCYSGACIATPSALCQAAGFSGACSEKTDCNSVTCYVSTRLGKGRYCYSIGRSIPDGTPCSSADVCFSGECVPRRVAEDVPLHCSNGIIDKGETDVDCGGSECRPCEVNRACLASSDCFSIASETLDCLEGTCTSLSSSGEDSSKSGEGKVGGIDPQEFVILGIGLAFVSIVLSILLCVCGCQIGKAISRRKSRSERALEEQLRDANVFPAPLAGPSTKARRARAEENEQPNLVQAWKCPTCAAVNAGMDQTCSRCSADGMTHVALAQGFARGATSASLRQHHDAQGKRPGPLSWLWSRQVPEASNDSPRENGASVVVMRRPDGVTTTTRVFFDDTASDDDDQ